MALGYTLPSLTTVICGVFTAYIIHSAWTLGQLFMPPSCPEYSECLHPLIAQEPKFQVRFKVKGAHTDVFSESKPTPQKICWCIRKAFRVRINLFSCHGHTQL